MENKDLIMEAIKVKENSYSPYTKFDVGACLEADDGTLIHGCNVEDATIRCGSCAERSAIFTAIANGHRKFKKIAIVGGDLSDYTFPCGTCRQMLHEFAPNIEIVLAKYSKDERLFVRSYKLPELFPRAFGPEDLDMEEEAK